MELLLVMGPSDARKEAEAILRTKSGYSLTTVESEDEALTELSEKTAAVFVDGQDPALVTAVFDLMPALCPTATKFIVGSNEPLEEIAKKHKAFCITVKTIHAFLTLTAICP